MEWVRYDFSEPTAVSRLEVYCFDDEGTGECRVPDSWQAYYRAGGEWEKIPGIREYGTAKDRFNIQGSGNP